MLASTQALPDEAVRYELQLGSRLGVLVRGEVMGRGGFNLEAAGAAVRSCLSPRGSSWGLCCGGRICLKSAFADSFWNAVRESPLGL